MLRFILLRLLQAIPTLLAVFTITFFITRLAPGDPVAEDRNYSPESKAAVLRYFGFTNDDGTPRSIGEQYVSYLVNVLPGPIAPGRLFADQNGQPTFDPLTALGIDFGPSMREARDVNEIIREHFPVSLQLGLLAVSFAVGIGVPVGVLAAVKKNTALDYWPMALAMIGICLPTFVIGPILLTTFGSQLRWFPVFGWETGDSYDPWRYRVLPAFTLGLVFAAYFARLARGGMLEVLSQDYIRTARAKGLSEFTIIWKHTLRGGLLPAVTFIGPTLAGVISGSFVVERVFVIPGLGSFFVNGALNRDYSLILGTVSFYAALIILMNLVVDILQVLLNPRLKFEN